MAELTIFGGVLFCAGKRMKPIQVIDSSMWQISEISAAKAEKNVGFDCGSSIKYINLIRNINIEREGNGKLNEKRTKIKSIEHKIVQKWAIAN